MTPLIVSLALCATLGIPQDEPAPPADPPESTQPENPEPTADEEDPALGATPLAEPEVLAEPADDPKTEAEPEIFEDFGPEAAKPQETVTAQAPTELERSGVYGWGLGLEVPMIGVLSGAAQKSSLGVGYSLGGAVSWEATPKILIRLAVWGGATTGGRARVSFDESGQRVQKEQSAEWLNLDVMLGAAYVFRSTARAWAPFVGADLGFSFSGYEYLFNDQLKDLEAPIDLTTDYDNGGHFGTGLGFSAAARGGVILELTPWLATVGELQFQYVGMQSEAISNTLQAPEVKTVAEPLFLMRGTFSVRVSL